MLALPPHGMKVQGSIPARVAVATGGMFSLGLSLLSRAIFQLEAFLCGVAHMVFFLH